MEQNFNRRIETDLDLNGPILAISSHPSDATVNHGATQTFSVTASATFPGNTGADDEGTLTYQWYEFDDGDSFATKLTDQTEGVTFSGTTTATLTLTGIESPAQNGLKYYCVIDYTPADRYAHAEKGAGHPLNGSVTSNSATLTVNPYLIITSQPASVDRGFNVDGDITITAALSDSTYSNDIGYQWYRNDVAISDGTVTTTRIERGTVTEIETEVRENEYEVVTRHEYSFSRSYSDSGTRTIPSTASNIYVEVSGGGGGKGGSDYPWNGGGDGGNGRRGRFELDKDLTRGTTLTMYAGKKGSDGIHGAGSGSAGAGGGYGGWAGGGNGGAAGGSGASGGGGGGGSAGGVYHGSLSTPIIVAGGGGGGGGESYGKAPGTNSFGIGYAYVRRLLGVHDNGKTIAYGDSDGNDWNATLKITSGDAKFLSEHSIGGSGSVGLYYEWADNPRRAGRSNTEIYVGGQTITHTYNRAGGQNVTVDLGTGSGNKDAGQWSNESTIYADGGHNGHPCECSDGAGGGGGGAGAVSSAGAGAGAPGAGGCDNVKGGFNGAGGESMFNGTYATLYSNTAGTNSGNGYVSLEYDWYVDVSETRTETEIIEREVEREIETSIPQNITFSGTKGSTLTVKADYETVENLKCVVSSPQSSNSPLTSNTVQFSSFSNVAERLLYMEQAFWKFDQWRGGYATGNMSVILSNSNLANDEVTLGYDDGSAGSSTGINIFTSFYVTSDTEVEIDLHGGRGAAWTSLGNDPKNLGYLAARNSPGEGGYGRIRLTLKANREYTVAGMFGTINTPYLYDRDEIIAVVAQGGGQAPYGDGGGGGGLNLSGLDGTGNNTDYAKGMGTGFGGFTGDTITGTGSLGTAYFPYRTDWQDSYYNHMLEHFTKQGGFAYVPDRPNGGQVSRYSRSINNNGNVSTRQMWVRQENGAGSGLPEYTLMGSSNGKTDTATIDRGFWDIDYAFLGTAGGRSDGPGNWNPTKQRLEEMMMNQANGVYDLNVVGGNGGKGGFGARGGGGGGGGGGWLNLDKDITLISTRTGSTGGGVEDSKIIIRLVT